MAKRGRPPKEIDQRQFENLCAMQCTSEEIGAWFDTTYKTLDAWCKKTYGENFSTVYQQKREKGKISLRRAQFQLAQKSASMAIWLGKQYLKQRETVMVNADDGKLADLIRGLQE